MKSNEENPLQSFKKKFLGLIQFLFKLCTSLQGSFSSVDFISAVHMTCIIYHNIMFIVISFIHFTEYLYSQLTVLNI